MNLFKYNDEFEVDKISPEYGERLQSYVKNVNNDKVMTAFNSSDAIAINLKKRFRRFGLICILFAFLALNFAALELAVLVPLKKEGHIEEAVLIRVALVAAAFGLGAALIGFSGMGIQRRKKQWIRMRLKTELIRQWRWNIYLNHWTDFAAIEAPESCSPSYEAEFASWTTTTDDNMGYITDHLPDVIDEVSEVSLDEIEEKLNSEFFDFYRERRILRQLRYSDFTLSTSGMFATHPRIQLSVLNKLEVLFGILIVFSHLLILLGVLANVDVLLAPPTHLLVVVSALSILAVKAIEKGLQPHEAIHRLQSYSQETRRLLGEFDRAKTSKGKYSVARKFEKVSKREAMEFVAQAEAASFVL